MAPDLPTSSPPPTGPEDASVPSNYLYWQQHGDTWTNEYETRKRRRPLYHIQEYMLVEYMMHHAPAKVLEFGCGVGRHLRNLSRVAGLDVYGHDQSATMVAGCRSWADEAWVARHVTVGAPTGPLPYPDGAFDIVYTAEVLVHVRPEDLESILRELLRVCRGHILHLETSPDCAISPTSHDGCWKHDLAVAYARLGRECQVLPRGYDVHTPYRVTVGEPAPRFTWPEPLMAMCRSMEQCLEQGFSELQERLDRSEAARADLESEVAEIQRTCRELRSRIATFEEFIHRVQYLLRPGTGA